MKLHKSILLIILLLLFGFVAKSQESVTQKSVTQNVSLLDGKLKSTLKIRVDAERAGSNEVSVKIDIIEGRGTYKVYLFDDKLKVGTNAETWKTSNDLVKWFKIAAAEPDASKLNFEQNFNGQFITWNDKRLERFEFDSGFWAITKESTSLKRFNIKNDHKSAGSLYFNYQFLFV